MKKKEEIKKREKKDKKKVYEFLKEHRDKAFTEKEVRNRTGVDEVELSHSLLDAGRVWCYYREGQVYYCWEREWTVLLIYGSFAFVAGLIICLALW